MSVAACLLLRHDVRPRWVGDLLAAYCHTCTPGHLIVPIDPPTPRAAPGLAVTAPAPRAQRERSEALT